MYDVYWNLHKFCFSFRSRKTGLVEHHAHEAVLDGVNFIVQPAGLERAKREGRKNVHAFLRAQAADLQGAAWSDVGHLGAFEFVTYNPYAEGSWVYRGDRDRKVPTDHPARKVLLSTVTTGTGKVKPVVKVLF